ncbi:MAG: DNA repair protein RecN [Rhodothermales bacterium]
MYIRDYALIEELQVEFDSGLNIITGETGAGKSILLGALKMILGERASTEVIRTDAKKAIIEGIFDNTGSPRIRKLLEENAFDPADQIILRREISASQSRAFVNDTPAPLNVVRDIASQLIDLHGQHEHQMLLRTETHIDLLDQFAGLGDLVSRYQRQYGEVAGRHRELESLIAQERDLRQQKELYEFQIGEIDAVAPEEGEEDALEGEERILANAERLYEVTAQLYDLLYEADGAVNDHLVRVRNELQDLTRIDAGLEESAREAESAQIVVAELAHFLQDYNARIEFNPERLEFIRSRLGDLEMLKRRYGGTLEAVIAHRREIGAKYELASNFELAIETLRAKIAEQQTQLSDIARRLSKKRREGAERVEKAILAELARLGMPHSRFEVRFSQTPAADGWVTDEAGQRLQAFPDGMDQVEFFISSNPGEALKPLARVASGGEISRIMLGLKTILAKSERLPILVFDEIDAGISGTIANKVGESMRDLAQYHQIIAITHLAQIAAMGDVHFRVAKHIEDGRTHTTISRLPDTERTRQVASLISGSEITEAALESARELMAAGRRPERV